MALSTGLIRRLNSENSDEPLAKRLKLAENVFYSPDLPIVRKEECIFRWLCTELSDRNNIEVWKTIDHCLSLEPKSFSKLSPETKNLMIESLIASLSEYPKNEVFDEMLKCCIYIFSSANIHNYSKESPILSLVKTLLHFTSNILYTIESKESKLTTINLAVECSEQAISSFSQICRQNFTEKKNLMMTFVDEIFFPLSLLIDILKTKKKTSKLILEIEKCIKRLLLSSIKTITPITVDGNENTEDGDALFIALKNKTQSTHIDEVKAAFTCLFQSAVQNFQQNFVLIDTVLRKLLGCMEQKDHSKQILVALLESAADVSFNFDNEINEVNLKTFLKNYVEDVISKKKRLKWLDYELVNSIAKLNPVIVEDITQIILQRILFEEKVSDKEEAAYDKLVKELWSGSVRLRRQHKFVSKFLMACNSYEDKEIEDLEFRNKFDLPKSFVAEFSENLKSRTTSSQIISIFQTLSFHLKSDCVSKIESLALTTQVCLLTKIVSRFFVLFFENSNFLDNSLSVEWQKFYEIFIELKNIIAAFADSLCKVNDKFEDIIFISFSNIVKVWCEAYDLLKYYSIDIANSELEFPVSKTHFKNFKKMIKNSGNIQCEESLNQLILFQSAIYQREDQLSIKEKAISQIWPVIVENHFETIELLDEARILELTSCLVNEACLTQDNLSKWMTVITRNIHRMTKKFATATALQIFSNFVKDVDLCATKTIIDKIDFEIVLKSLDDPESLTKSLKAAYKEIAKQEFKSLDVVDVFKIKKNVQLLSNLPLQFLDKSIRKLLFLTLYIFEEEVKSTTNLQNFVINLYLDFLRQNDVEILSTLSQTNSIINHFKDHQLILSKLFKLSLIDSSKIVILEELIDSEEYSRKLSSILLNCIESTKLKASSELKSVLLNLSLKLSKKLIKKLDKEVEDSDEITGLRIALKLTLHDKKKIKSNLKKCVELTLQRMLQDTEVTDTKFIEEILLLSLVVLSNRDHFDIDQEVVKKLCLILTINTDAKVFFHFLEILKDNEFEFFAKSLRNQTKEHLISGNTNNLEQMVNIWRNLSKAEAKGTRSKSLCISVNNLLNDLLSMDISENSSVYLLKICRAFVTSKRMIQLTSRIVDSILVLSSQALNKLNKATKLVTCQEALGLNLDFLRTKAEFILDKLQVITNLFRKTVKIIFSEAKETGFSDEHMLRILAVDIEKFCSFFAKLKNNVSRISPYLIADLIDVTSSAGVLPPYLKISVESSLSHLLSNCDRHAISFLNRTLPTSVQQVFKTIYDNYKRYHKFTGKI